jgi:hypothetical protein
VVVEFGAVAEFMVKAEVSTAFSVVVAEFGAVAEFMVKAEVSTAFSFVAKFTAL